MPQTYGATPPVLSTKFNSVLQDAGAAIVRDEIVEEFSDCLSRDDSTRVKEYSTPNINGANKTIKGSPNLTKMYDMSLGKRSIVDSEVDGLIDWAN